LGTITHLKNGSNPADEYSFDAWGRRRDKDDWTYTLASEPALFADRGFTAHEYLADFKLYNMNGRMYDPVVGRFLSPDPYIQAPDFSQNFNRYSYCLNNPLRYNDLSGYTWGIFKPFAKFGKWVWNDALPALDPVVLMQKLNDKTEKLREKMDKLGIPDFSIGGSVNLDGNVHARGEIMGQEVFNTANIDRSNATQKVNQAINDARQIYGDAWREASYGSQYVASNGTRQGYGNPAISWGATFAFSSPFSSNKSNIDHGGYGLSFGRFTGTNTRGIYITTMKGDGVMLSFSMDATYYNNRIGENLELGRIKGYGTMRDVGVRYGGYSLSSDGYSLFNQHPTYNAHTLSVGWGMDVGYTQWQTKTYVIPTVPWIGLLINQY